MTTSLNILQRLNAVMQELDYIQKEKKGGLQYSFVSHDKVTGVVRPLLVKHGIVCWPSDFNVSQDGNRTQLRCKVVFANMDDRSDFIEVDSLGYGIDSQDKGPGKAMSYAMKYAYLKALSLETGDDPDNDQTAVYTPPSAPIAMPAANGTPGASKAANRAPYEALVKEIRNAASLAALKAWYQANVTKIDELPPDFVDELRVEYNDKQSELKKGLAA